MNIQPFVLLVMAYICVNSPMCARGDDSNDLDERYLQQFLRLHKTGNVSIGKYLGKSDGGLRLVDELWPSLDFPLPSNLMSREVAFLRASGLEQEPMEWIVCPFLDENSFVGYKGFPIVNDRVIYLVDPSSPTDQCSVDYSLLIKSLRIAK